MHTSTDIPLKEPTEVTAGDTIKWRREDLTEHYPADEWTLSYYIFGVKGSYTVNATADGDYFAVTVTAAESTAWQPGDYSFKGYVTKTSTSERYEIFSGSLKVNTNPAQLGSESHDDRSWAKKCLDAIEGEMERRAGRSDRSYSIAGRNLDYMTHLELLDARARYAAMVAAEKEAVAVANGKATGRRILTKFTAVS